MDIQGDDPELEAIRQRRMQEIMAQQGGQVCLIVTLLRKIIDKTSHGHTVVTPPGVQKGWADDRRTTATAGTRRFRSS